MPIILPKHTPAHKTLIGKITLIGKKKKTHLLKHFLSTRWVIKMIGDYRKRYITKLDSKWSIKGNNLSSFHLTAK